MPTNASGLEFFEFFIYFSRTHILIQCTWPESARMVSIVTWSRCVVYPSKPMSLIYESSLKNFAFQVNYFSKFKFSSTLAVQFEYGADGRPTGRATVAFASHSEAQEAMQLNKSVMGEFFFSFIWPR